jgi:hypothetical protein
MDGGDGGEPGEVDGERDDAIASRLAPTVLDLGCKCILCLPWIQGGSEPARDGGVSGGIFI